MFKLYVFVIFATCAVLAAAADDIDIAEDYSDAADAKETGRFAFVNYDTTTGALSFTFNATSVQYSLLAGLALLTLAVLALPLLGLLGLLGLKGKGKEEDESYAYAYEQPAVYTSYQTPQANAAHSSYSKRSLSLLGPVMEALAKKFKKYEDEEEKDH